MQSDRSVNVTVQESKRVQEACDIKIDGLIKFYKIPGFDLRPLFRPLRDALADALMVECLESELSDLLAATDELRAKLYEQRQSTPLAATP
jgi:hypothetical protein